MLADSPQISITKVSRTCFLGSTGCQQSAAAPNAYIYDSHKSDASGSRQAAANYRLAGCAPQNLMRIALKIDYTTRRC